MANKNETKLGNDLREDLRKDGLTIDRKVLMKNLIGAGHDKNAARRIAQIALRESSDSSGTSPATGSGRPLRADPRMHGRPAGDIATSANTRAGAARALSMRPSPARGSAHEGSQYRSPTYALRQQLPGQAGYEGARNPRETEETARLAAAFSSPSEGVGPGPSSRAQSSSEYLRQEGRFPSYTGQVESPGSYGRRVRERATPRGDRSSLSADSPRATELAQAEEAYRMLASEKHPRNPYFGMTVDRFPRHLGQQAEDIFEALFGYPISAIVVD